MNIPDVGREAKESIEREPWLKGVRSTDELIIKAPGVNALSKKEVFSASLSVIKKFGSLSHQDRLLLETAGSKVEGIGAKCVEKPLAALDMLNQALKLIDAIQRDDMDAAVDAGVYFLVGAAQATELIPAGLILAWHYEMGHKAVLLLTAGFLRDIKNERERRYIEYVAHRGADAYDEAFYLYANVTAYDQSSRASRSAHDVHGDKGDSDDELQHLNIRYGRAAGLDSRPMLSLR